LAQTGRSHANSISASVTTCVWIALISLGLTTAVQPAAIAAASLPQMKPASLFHGVMRPATPRGFIIIEGASENGCDLTDYDLF
jgi:hypothetical protein